MSLLWEQRRSYTFYATGIYPFNRSVFTEVDFLPAEVTEQTLDSEFGTADSTLFDSVPKKRPDSREEETDHIHLQAAEALPNAPEDVRESREEGMSDEHQQSPEVLGQEYAGAKF